MFLRRALMNQLLTCLSATQPLSVSERRHHFHTEAGWKHGRIDLGENSKQVLIILTEVRFSNELLLLFFVGIRMIEVVMEPGT